MTQPPNWLAELADVVATAIVGVALPAPIGCHFFRNELLNQWELTLFPGTTEIVGGKLDGRIKPSPFTLDLARLTWALDSLDRFHWQSHRLGADDELGPHVSLEGTHQGHAVWVRILAEAPEQFEISRRVHTAEQAIEDLW